MDLIIFLLMTPYLLTPWLMAFVFRRYHPGPLILSYLLTTILAILYTFVLQELAMPAPNPEGGGICAPPVFIIIVPLLPLSLAFQALFNKIIKPSPNPVNQFKNTAKKL